MDDLTLAWRAAGGDEKALAVLYDRYADLLFALIYHHLPDSRQDAEEVWQDTWLAAIRSLESYRGSSRFFTWLVGIARHKIADHFRRRGFSEPELFSNIPESRLAELIDSSPLPEEILLKRIVRRQVVEALAILSEDQRWALMAHYIDERSVEEVADLLGKSYKAAESLLSRARKAFQKAFIQVESEERNER
jgi:RNA polymerase sigma-70 factor (ECF subfamily)